MSCDPRAKAGVTAFYNLMKARYKTGGAGTYRPCQGDTSEHYEGRALDWMLNVNNPRQKAVANSVTAWLSARGGVMARRFGLSYIIFNKRVFKLYRPGRGWTAYTGSSPHTDHIHFSFTWDGALKRTSWWTGRATTVVNVGPCRVYAGQFAPLYAVRRTAECPTSLRRAPVSPYRVAVYGQRSAQIAVAQRRLGLRADGKFGSGTFGRLVSWQRRAGVPITGALDKATWVRLSRGAPVPAASRRAAPRSPQSPFVTRYTPYKPVVLRQGSKGSRVVFLQRALRVSPDGAFGPITRSALVAFQARQRITRNAVANRLVWNRLEKRDFPLVAYRRYVLRQGSKGAAVVVLQRALKVPADGVFGLRTKSVVKYVQARTKLKATGVVNGWTWVVIENKMMRR